MNHVFFLIVYFFTVLFFSPLSAMEKVDKQEKIIFSCQTCTKDFPVKISSYWRGNTIVSKIEDLNTKTITYEYYTIIMSNRATFLYEKQNSQDMYTQYEEIYISQQKELEKQNKLF